MESIREKFDILNPVSDSQDSTVYLIRKKDTDDYFLLKSIKERKGTSESIIDRKILFRKEINIVSSLDHQNIAKLADTHFDGKTYSLIYPYRKGKTLSSIFEKGLTFSTQDSLNLILQLLDALEYIHLRGIIHCDINPNNIFVDDEKGVTLLDFGYSLTEEEAIKLPEGRIVGTFPYLSLEQIGFTEYKIDAPSDLFCTALILYRLLSGKLPFTIQNNSIEELLNQILKAEIQPIKNLPAILNAILIKALKPSPDDRYQTATGFKYDLKVALEALNEKYNESFVVGKTDNIAAVNRIKMFVARENEIDTLQKGLEQFSKGNASSFLFYGKSGIGKTYIVNQFRTKINEDNLFFLASNCNRFTPTQPYSIFRHLILEFILKTSSVSDDEIEQFKTAINDRLLEYSGIICRIIPEMEDYFLEIKEIGKVEKEKEADRINHVLTLLLQTLCDIKPPIIFIDDFQWIDQTTFEIIKNHLKLKPTCMIIFNFRIEKTSEDIYVFGNNLKKIGIKNIIPIHQFTKNEIKELIFSRFGDIEEGDVLVEILLNKTDASPFTLTEAIRYLVNNSILRSEQQGWYFYKNDLENLPDKFDPASLILSKLGWLNEEEKRYLTLASLIEGKFERIILEKFGNFTPETSKTISHRLANFGFIVRQLSGGYSFTHDRVKEAISSHISKNDKFILNEKLAQIYELLIPSSKEYLFDATECYLKSANLKKSIEFCYQAATYSVEKVAFDVAIHYFKFTMLMASQCPLVNIPVPIDMIKVQIAFGDVLMLTGRNQQALNIFKKLINENTALRKNQALQLKYKIGSIYNNMGDFENSIKYFTSTLGELKIKFPRNKLFIFFSLLYELIKQFLFSYGLKHLLLKNKSNYLTVRILNKLSYSLYFQDMIACLFAHFKSLNLSDLLENSFEKAETYSLHMVPAFQMFLKKRSFNYLKKSIKIAKKINRKDILAFSQCFGGIVHFYNSKWKESEKYFNKSIKNYQSVGDFWGQITPIEHFGWMKEYLGNINESIDFFNKEINQCIECNDLRGLLNATSTKAFLLELMGLNNTKEYKTLEEKKLKIHDSLVQTIVNINLVKIHILRNQFETCFNINNEIIKTIKEKSLNQEYVASAYSNYCEILIQEKRNRLAENTQLDLSDKELLKELSKYSKKAFIQGIIYPAHMGAALRSKAWYYSFKGKKGKVKKLFLKAIKRHHILDMRYEEAKSIRDYGLFLDDCNLPGEARDQYNAAYKLFHVCGAKLETERLKEKADYDTTVYELEKASLEKRSEEEKKPSKTMSSVSQIRVDTLYNVSSSLTEINDIDLLFKQILNAMIRATGAQFAWLFLEETDRYEQNALCIDYHGKIHNREEIPFSRRIVEQVKEERKTVLIRDVSQENTLLQNGEDTGRINIIRSVLCVPLCHLDNYLGCVYLGNNIVSGLFSEESRKIVQILSTQAGVLLENAYLVNEYKKLNKYLQQRVNEQTKDIREKNNQLISSNLKLVDSERMKNMLTGTIVHDIKNYAAGIEGNVNVLGRKYSNDQPLKRTVGLVTSTCVDIVNLTSNLLDIGRMEESKLDTKKELLGYDQVCKIVKQFKDNIIFEERNISVSIIPPQNNFSIEADVYLLTRVFQNLFSNAAKYAPKNGKVVISMESGVNEDTICFSSSGTPIPEKDRNIIFDKYSRVEDKRTLYSKGLGLFFCKLVANAHQGRIWLETDENGNHFKITFKKTLEHAAA